MGRSVCFGKGIGQVEWSETTVPGMSDTNTQAHFPITLLLLSTQKVALIWRLLLFCLELENIEYIFFLNLMIQNDANYNQRIFKGS